jgi:choline dehydrogenase-like flavoprotein
MTGQRYRNSTTVDFVVVGSGASGGVIARELAVAGFSTVVLEQGSRLTPADFEHDELKYWFQAGITNDPAQSTDIPVRSLSDCKADRDSARALVCPDRQRQQYAFHHQLLALP